MNVIDVRYKPAGVDPMGKVDSASLIVSARLVPLKLQYGMGLGRNESGYTLEHFPSCASDSFVPDFDLGFFFGYRKEVYAMRLFREGDSTTYFVLLCLDESKRIYERIGCATTALEYPNTAYFATELRRLFDDIESERVITIV
jgi:hypothetical protein